MINLRHVILSVFTLVALCGCGTYPPQIAELTDRDEGPRRASLLLETRIKEQVYCDIRKAVLHATDESDKTRVRVSRGGKEVAALPDSWGVQITLTLQVDELGAANPGVSLIRPFANSQSFTLGLGATASSTATRIDKFNFYYDVSKLKTRFKRPQDDSCFYDENGVRRDFKEHGSSLLLESNLDIDGWLQNALYIENDYKSNPLSSKADSTLKQDALTYEAKFVVITGGSITPTLKLVRLSTGQGSLPLVNASRTRSHDLLITFGPSEKSDLKVAGQSQSLPSGPSALAANAHLASQIGLSVANNLRPLVPQ